MILRLFLTVAPIGNNLSILGACKGFIGFLTSICQGVKCSSPLIPLEEGAVSGDELPAVTGVDVEVFDESTVAKFNKKNIIN